MTRNLPSLREIAVSGVPTKPGLSLETLDALLCECDAETKIIASAKKAIVAYLEQSYGGDIAHAYAASDKDFGSVRVSDGGYEIHVDTPKKVEWDQSKLRAIRAAISDSGDDPSEYLKETLTVDERAFAAWPSHIRATFLDARTLKPGSRSIKLVRKEAA